MLKVFIQHVRDHAQHVRQFTVGDLVFEVADDDRGEILAHDSDCFAPIRRSRAGWLLRSIMRSGEGRLDQFVERLLWPLRLGESVGVAGEVDLVGLDAFGFARGDLHP